MLRVVRVFQAFLCILSPQVQFTLTPSIIATFSTKENVKLMDKYARFASVIEYFRGERSKARLVWETPSVHYI